MKSFLFAVSLIAATLIAGLVLGSFAKEAIDIFAFKFLAVPVR